MRTCIKFYVIVCERFEHCRHASSHLIASTGNAFFHRNIYLEENEQIYNKFCIKVCSSSYERPSLTCGSNNNNIFKVQYPMYIKYEFSGLSTK